MVFVLEFIAAWVLAWGVVVGAFFVSGYIVFGIEDLIVKMQLKHYYKKKKKVATLTK